MSLIKELQRRNVFRVAAAYVVVAWLLIQVGATLEPAMHLPDWVDSVLAFFLLLGFPVALFFAWAYELTPEGLKRDGEVDPAESTRSLAGHKWDRLIIVVLVLALGYFALDKYVLAPRPATIAEQTAGEPAESAAATGSAAREPVAAAKAEPAIPEKSIAVLPFVNMSSDPEQEYFSDGLTEELLNLLADIGELKVAARTSSFFYKDKVKDIPFIEIGRQLGVAYLLEGSVRRGGDKIRITAQLIKAEDGFHLWSETYDRALDDVFAIQDEISAAVVDALKVTLLGEAPHATVIDTESWELTQQARFFYNRRGPGEMQQALELFERAVELDPNNATAWVGLVPLYFYLFDPPRVDDSMAAVDRALELDPDNPEALIRKSGFANYLGQRKNGAELQRRALEAGPDNVLVLGIVAGREWWRGNYEHALELHRRALALDPLHIVNIGNMAGFLVELGRFDEAEKWATKLKQLAPESPMAANSLATIKLFQGDLDTAQRYIDEMESEEGDLPAYIPGEKAMLQAMLDYSRGNEAASLAGLEAYREHYRDRFPVGVAYIHAWRGELEQAWNWVDYGREANPDSYWLEFANHVFLRPLRDDPRWEDLMAHFDALIEQNVW